MTVATARKRSRREPEPAPAALPVFGNYRCYHDHPDFPGRPCNKYLGTGSGAYSRPCPRCKLQAAFRNPNDPIR